MADAVGTRNIWDCIGKLQPNGDSSKADSRSRRATDEESDSKSGDTSFDESSQQLPSDAIHSNRSGSRLGKGKKRESVTLLASMQKKLKISHFNLSQKPVGSVNGKETIKFEYPLDLSTKYDETRSTSLTDSPLDLSVKKESENVSVNAVLQLNSLGELKGEETLRIANSACQTGGLISISKPFAALPNAHKKVSPVRPHIGGKPVVTDSNGNIPLCTFSESGVKRNVFSNLCSLEDGVPADERSAKTVSVLQQSCNVESNFKKASIVADSSRKDLQANQVLTDDFKRSRCIANTCTTMPVIDYRSGDLSSPSHTVIASSCSSVDFAAPVPDLVKSTLGFDSCNKFCSPSKTSTDWCLNIPTYSCHRKSKTVSKKPMKSRQSIGVAQKRKNVPLAEVRPSCLLHSTPVKPLENLTTASALPLSVSLPHTGSVLCPQTTNTTHRTSPVTACIVGVSLSSTGEKVLDSSGGSPPTLCVFSPTSKTSANDSILSPQMPILSPLHPVCDLPSVSTSTHVGSAHQFEEQHRSLYSFASCSTDMVYAKNSCQYSHSVMSATAKCSPDVTLQTAAIKTLLEPTNEPLLVTVLSQSNLLERGCTTSINSLNMEFPELENSGETGQTKYPKQDLYGHFGSKDDNIDSGDSVVIADDQPVLLKDSFKQNSGTASAFSVNTAFCKDVYKESKVVLYAALAFDFEASTSANLRPYRNMIQKTRYYKAVAQTLGLPVARVEEEPEPVLMQTSPSKGSRGKSSLGKGRKSLQSKSKSQELPLVTVPSVDTPRQETGGNAVARKGRTGQSEIKKLISCSTGTSPETQKIDTDRVTRSAKRRSLQQQSMTDDDVDQAKSSTSDVKREPAISGSVDVTGSPNLKDLQKSTDKETAITGKRLADKTSPMLQSKRGKFSNNSTNNCDRIEVLAADSFRVTVDSGSLDVECSPNLEDHDVTLLDNVKDEIVEPSLTSEVSSLVKLDGVNGKVKSRKICDAAFISTSNALGKNACTRDDATVATNVTSVTTKRTELTKFELCRPQEVKLETVTVKKEILELPQELSNRPAVATPKQELKETKRDSQFLSEEKDIKSIKRSAKQMSVRQNCSLLRELANSDGYVAEKRTPRRSDNLFMDSRLLTREERSLQMALMRMTKMEVREEWSKIKGRNDNQKMKQTEPVVAVRKAKTEEPQKGKHLEQNAPHKETSNRFEIKVVNQKGKSKTYTKLKNTPDTTSLRRKTKPPKTASLRDSGVAEKRVAKNVVRKIYSSTKKPKTRMIETECSTWVNKTVKKHAKKRGGRFRYRWKSGIWKQKTKHSSSPKAKTKALTETKPKINQKMYQSLTVDVGALVPSTSSLSPLSTISSKLSSPFSSEKTYAKDDDVLSMSSSVADSTPSRRLIPAEVKKLVTCHATGETVLHRAARLGYSDVALWCCQSRYTDVNAKDFAGYTPLHETFLHSNVSIARYLIHYGADLNSAAERRGGTRPLHEAVECDSTEMVRLLLSAGADINLTSYSGKTVQDVAQTTNMKNFLKAYFDDLNGGPETEWNFRPSWDVLPDDCQSDVGMDLLADAPCDDEESDHPSVAFQCSEKVLPESYVLKTHKKDMPRSYVLLCDVLERLQVTKEQFLLDNPEIAVEKFSQECLFPQFSALEFLSGNELNDVRKKCTERFVDLVPKTFQLQKLLDVESLKISCLDTPNCRRTQDPA